MNEFGIIGKVSYDEKQVDLIWRNSDNPEFSQSETVSAFDISSHPDYVFRIGELVVYSPTQKPEMETGSGDKKAEKVNTQAVGMIKDITDDGKIIIIWTNLSTSAVCPTSLLSESVLFGDAFDELESDAESDEEDEWEDDDDEMESSGETDQSWETDSNQSENANLDISDADLTSAEDLQRERDLANQLISSIKDQIKNEPTDESSDGMAERIKHLEAENQDLREINQELMSNIKMDEINANGIEKIEKSENNDQIDYIDFPDSTHSYYSTTMPTYKKGYLKDHDKKIFDLITKPGLYIGCPL